MPRLEVYDTVAVKSDRTLIGSVERTFSESEAVEPLDEYFILLNIPVPKDVLADFVANGMPPRGYVFVTSLEEERGSFLALEDDLVLLSRSFDLGDVVKRPDGMTGTVVDVSDAYSLQPIWLPDGTPSSSLPQKHIRHCLLSSEDDCQHNVLSHIPGQELVHHQALFEEDLICFKDWLGVVSELDLDVVLQVGNSIVVLDSPEDLYLPIDEPSLPLVSLPEFEGSKRPDIVSAFQGHSWVLPIKYPRVGSFIVTSHTTLKNGRWIVGSFKADLPHAGTVLDLVPHTIFCQWRSCNPFAALRWKQIRQPSPTQVFYDNSGSYKSGTALKPNCNIRVIDLLSPPRSEILRSMETDIPSSGPSSESRPPTLHQDFKVGDCVKFRDASAAAVKYQGGNDTSTERFNRIPTDLSHGWDLNVFRIIAQGQSVHVLWQDGATDSLDSNELQRFGGFESDFSPTDIVVNRAGMKMMKDGERRLRDFSEMTFFEAPHSLHPVKVGVIQSVDSRERFAKVRWFEQPRLSLHENGNRLSPDSKLGPISDAMDELSLYEVMTFPALDRHLRDVALLLPSSPSKRAMDIIHSQSEIKNERRDSYKASLLDPQNIFYAVRDVIRKRGFLNSGNGQTDKENKNRERHNTISVDWLGEIIKVGLDGTLTIRLSGATPVRDVVVSFDDILAVIRPEYVLDQDSVEEEEVLDEIESMWYGEEEVEYEGGERIDNDTDDDNWVSEEEHADDVDQSEGELQRDLDVEMSDAPPDPYLSTKAVPWPDPKTPDVPSFADLTSHLPSTAPPSFDVLSMPPPPDQYRPPSSSNPVASTSFLKRIRHEHKVLSTSLPPRQIYVRTYDSRLDLLRCLIIGPADTPYEHAPFLVDLYLPPTFPIDPPVAHFHSWTSGLGRINPNLYEEGKICLSLLGTWPGKDSKEGWSTHATILQVLVSLQGLVMVQKPFYNEAGFENEETGGGYVNESATYSERAYVMARGFVGFAMTRPPVGVEDILAWLYLPSNTTATTNPDEGASSDGETRSDLLRIVRERAHRLIETSETLRSQDQKSSPTQSQDQDQQQASTSNTMQTDTQLIDGAGSPHDPTKSFLRPLSKGAVVMLNRQLRELQGCLDRWWEDRRPVEHTDEPFL